MHANYGSIKMDRAIADKLISFFSKYPPISLKKGGILIDPNNDPSGVFFIEQGIVRRYWIFENGNEITLNLYKPHAFLPMSWVIGNVPNTHFYEAMTNIQVRKAPVSDVIAFLTKESDIVYDLLKRVYIGMEGLWEHMQCITHGQSSTKLIAIILLLAKRFGQSTNSGGKIEITLRIGEKDLANYAGISRETVSRELQKLRKLRIISFTRGFLTIIHSKRLEKMLRI